MKNAINPYGQGDAAKKTVDAIKKYYAKGILNITSPEEIMTSLTRRTMRITEDISVNEFESNYNALIRMIFDDGKMIFPTNELNLNEMRIIYDEYDNKFTL